MGKQGQKQTLDVLDAVAVVDLMELVSIFAREGKLQGCMHFY